MKILILVFLLWAQQGIGADHTFYWKWQLIGDKLNVSGTLGNDKAVSVTCDAQAAIDKFAILYSLIDRTDGQNFSDYKKTVDTLSELFLKPFLKDITNSHLLVVQIDTTLVFFPIELLTIRKYTVAIYRPMKFQVNGHISNPRESQIRLQKGFILRDSTADPENACQHISEKYPQSEFNNINDVPEHDLLRKRNLDFILVSAHGGVDGSTLRVGIVIDSGTRFINTSFLQASDPKIVFIDACKQGINLAYIEALSSAKKEKYYIGPIISNDAGESSTKTINWFFANLSVTNNPVQALWKTRIKLYEYYRDKLNELKVINKSFIFRVYEL